MAKTHKRMARLERMMAKLLAEVAHLKDELITKPEAERVLRRLQEEERVRSIQEEMEKMKACRSTLTNAPGGMMSSGVALKQQYQQQLLGSLGGDFEKFEKHMLEHAKEMLYDPEEDR